MCFPKNFAEVLRTPILQNVDRLLLLKHLLKMKKAAPDNVTSLENFTVIVNTPGERSFVDTTSKKGFFFDNASLFCDLKNFNIFYHFRA